MWSALFFLSCLLVVAPTVAFVPTQNAFGVKRSSALNVAISTADIKNGLTIELDGEPYKVMSFSIMKQARGAAKTTIKFKNLMKGNTIENTYRSGEKFETAMIEKQAAIFSYNDENGNYYFMDAESFDEVAVGPNVMDEKKDWVDEGMQVNLVNFKNQVIEVSLPTSAVYTITETEPNMKGNTAQGHTKPATLSSGAVINIPGYLEQGEAISVDIESGAFLGRA